MEITAISIGPDIIKNSAAEKALSPPERGKQQFNLDDKDNYQDPVNKSFTEKQIIRSIEQANKSLVFHNTRLEFSIHEKTKEIMVKVLDDSSGDLIREIPPEKVLDMVAEVWKKLGLLVDEKA